METKKFDFFFSRKFEIEFDLYFDLCWRAEIIQVGLNMHLYVDIGDASSSLWGSTSSFFFFVCNECVWLCRLWLDRVGHYPLNAAETQEPNGITANTAHLLSRISCAANSMSVAVINFFFLRDFIFKKTLFEKLQY